jgi:hypothetical protein
MTDLERLQNIFTAYVTGTGLSASTVSRQFLGGGGRWADVMNGGDIGVRRVAQAIQDFADRWPEGLTRPDCLPDAAPCGGVPGWPEALPC